MALVSHFFAFVAHFLVFLTHLGFFHRFIFIVLDFSSIFPRFWTGFGKVFRLFLILFSKHAKTCGSQQNTAWAHEFQRSALKKTSKFRHKTTKKTMQIDDQKKTIPKIAQKSDLGGSWALFGKGLGSSGPSWGYFWAHFDCLLDVPNHIFLKHWSKMGSKRPFGWLLDRFWEGLGRIWMRLGRIWAFKIKAFASHGHFLNTLGVPCCLTLRYKNPRAASLRLAERHN